MMRVLLLGGTGHLGSALRRRTPGGVQLAFSHHRNPVRDSVFFDLEANLKAFEKRSDDASLAGSGKKISVFLKSLDLIKTMPDYEAALEPKFVQALKK